MRYAVHRSSRFTTVLLAVGMFLCVGSTALAQQLQPKATIEEPYLKYRKTIEQYLAAQIQAAGPNDKEARDAATAAARWFLLRLTRAAPQQVDHEYLWKCVHEFDREVMAPALKYAAQNKAFMEIFNRQMIAVLKDELLAADFKTSNGAQINGCLMLTSLAKYGDEACGDYLVELLKNPKVHDAIKVHVLRGLRAFFEARPPSQPPVLDVDDQKVRATDAARVAAVLDFVGREPPKMASEEETEAFRFIRREAIKALAQSRIPAEVIDKNGVKTPVALGLMKVLAAEKNGVNPPPSLTEKAEAAIGLCRMTSKLEKYQPEAAMYLVGRFLTEFAAKYREDAGNLKGNERPPMLPWKYYAMRLENALQQMNNNARDAAYRDKLNKLVDSSKSTLENMKRHIPVDDPATTIIPVLTPMWPQTPALMPYQGVPGVQIQMPPAQQGQ
jgi:hypothetical protein